MPNFFVLCPTNVKVYVNEYVFSEVGFNITKQVNRHYYL